MNPAASPTTYFHVWFSTKWRRPVLNGEIRDFILAMLASIAADKRITILEAEAIQDHVHLLVGVKQDQRLPVIMHDLKGATARAVFLAYPTSIEYGDGFVLAEELRTAASQGQSDCVCQTLHPNPGSASSSNGLAKLQDSSCSVSPNHMDVARMNLQLRLLASGPGDNVFDGRPDDIHDLVHLLRSRNQRWGEQVVVCDVTADEAALLAGRDDAWADR